MQKSVQTRQLIIGCGTGRCGTVSLMQFLNSQVDVSILHEGLTADKIHHLIPWYKGETQLWSWMTELEKLSNGASWYGDIGFYYLPYLPRIFDRYPKSRAICLERRKKAVIRSFLKKTTGRNHWYMHKGVGWKEDAEWDNVFPYYAEPNKSKAIGLYWDYYHSTAMEYCALFPDQFMLVPTSALNTTKGRLKILGFIGYDREAMLDGRFRANNIRHK
ncbi:MAG: sulfotransferase [Gammaproteobacteria bacterium]